MPIIMITSQCLLQSWVIKSHHPYWNTFAPLAFYPLARIPVETLEIYHLPPNFTPCHDEASPFCVQWNGVHIMV